MINRLLNTLCCAAMLSCAVGCGPLPGSDTADAGTRPGSDASIMTVDASVAMTPDASVAIDAELDPCRPEVLKATQAKTTYYVAINDRGASNSTCDGRAPKSVSNTHCPFKDFTSPKVQRLLVNATSRRVVVRAGTYTVRNWKGIVIQGAGTEPSERVELVAYPGEKVILDSPDPTATGKCNASAPNAQANPYCVREIIHMSGTYNLIQGFTIRNGLAYELEITGGAHHTIRCNRFDLTAFFQKGSDMLKMDGHADDISVIGNEFTKWRSQAMDITGVSNVLIEGNHIHAPNDPAGDAIGMKFGTRDVTIRNNRIHDLGSAATSRAFNAGGTGSPHPDSAQAYRLRMENNHIWNVGGNAVVFVSCQNCAFTGNEVTNVGLGPTILGMLPNGSTGAPQCSARAAGCLPNTGISIIGNRFKAIRGTSPMTANTFIGFERGESTGLKVGFNVYCATPKATDAQFVLDGAPVRFSVWSASIDDTSSMTAASSSALCSPAN